MSKIEELLKKRQENLIENSPIFKEIEVEREKLQKIKNQMWQKMFNDINTLDVYTNRIGFLDTGIPCYNNLGDDYLTICFCYDKENKDYLKIYGVKHNIVNNKMIPKFNDSTFFGYIDKKQPYINYNSNCRIDDKVEKVLKSWTLAFSNIQNNLEVYLDYNIEKKMNETKKSKELLEQEILNYSKEL